jgi:hypothetical protein
MSTRAQRRAARLNSEKSTGPRTEALADLSREFHKSSKAVGPQELYCVERMILCYWRMRRIGAIEVEILQSTVEQSRDKRLALLIRYETSLQRTYDRAVAELRNLQYMRGNTTEPQIPYAARTIETEKSTIGFVSQNTTIEELEAAA